MQVVKIVAKFVFAFGIIYWLVANDKLDLSLLKDSLSHPQYWAAALFLMIGNIYLGSFRLKWILEIVNKKPIPHSKVLSINWIGLLFSTVLPGSVTGDLIKILYIRDINKEFSKSFLLTSVFLDRIFGLFALALITLFFSLLSYDSLVAISSNLETLIHFNIIACFGVMGFFVFLWLPKKYQEMLKNILLIIPFLGEKIGGILEQFWLVQQDKKAFIKCFFLSLYLQAATISAFLILAFPYLDVEISIPHAFTFVPLGMVGIAIPIAPVGLGVGHVLFERLFSLFGVTNGASLFNFFIVSTVTVNLMGIFPYVLGGRKYSVSDTEE